ncbi:MAG TPA: uroporphyrinogen-III synthase [Devosia sp.]|nr:uroporphyrinogen-III synthase [Devosia sp.]
MAKLLITRPAPDNQRTAKLLAAQNIETELLPLLSFGVLDAQLPDITGFAALAVTSANTIRALEELGMFGTLKHLSLFAVGEKTAESARAAGFTSISTASGNVESLGKLIFEAGPAGPVLYPAARDRSGNLAAVLAAHNIKVTTIPVYAMQAKINLSAAETAMLRNDSIDGVLFYSARTAETFATLTQNSGLKTIRQTPALCLSRNIAEPLREAGFEKIHVAEASNESAMMALALSFTRSKRK